MCEMETFAEFLNKYCDRTGISLDGAFDMICREDTFLKVNKLVESGRTEEAFVELDSAEKIPQDSKDSDLIFARKLLYEKLSGKQDFVISLVSRFGKGHDEDCENICSRAEDRDFLGARSILHDILGLSGNLCLQRLYFAAGQLRKQCIAEKITDLSDFRGAWKETVFIIELYLKLYSKNETERSSGSDVDFEKLKKEFAALCSDCDIRAVEFFDEHKADFRGALSEEDYKKIETAVYRYDFGFIAENI